MFPADLSLSLLSAEPRVLRPTLRAPKRRQWLHPVHVGFKPAPFDPCIPANANSSIRAQMKGLKYSNSIFQYEQCTQVFVGNVHIYIYPPISRLLISCQLSSVSTSTALSLSILQSLSDSRLMFTQLCGINGRLVSFKLLTAGDHQLCSYQPLT